jgi:hypothetical protein
MTNHRPLPRATKKATTSTALKSQRVKRGYSTVRPGRESSFLPCLIM